MGILPLFNEFVVIASAKEGRKELELDEMLETNMRLTKAEIRGWWM